MSSIDNQSQVTTTTQTQPTKRHEKRYHDGHLYRYVAHYRMRFAADNSGDIRRIMINILNRIQEGGFIGDTWVPLKTINGKKPMLIVKSLKNLFQSIDKRNRNIMQNFYEIVYYSFKPRTYYCDAFCIDVPREFKAEFVDIMNRYIREYYNRSVITEIEQLQMVGQAIQRVSVMKQAIEQITTDE